MYFIWFLIYEMVYIISAEISQELKWEHWGTCIGLVMYICFFLGWLSWTGKRDEIALRCYKVEDIKSISYFIPFLALPFYNYMLADTSVIDSSWVLLMLCVVSVEEIFFRGVLYGLLSEWSKVGYIVVSSVIFALFHLMNFGEGADWLYVEMQAIAALGMGIACSAMVVYGNSIYPCIILHFLVNISSGCGIKYEMNSLHSVETYGLVFCVFIYIFFGIVIYRKSERK